MLLPTRPLRVATGPSCSLLLPAFIGKERCCDAWTGLTRSIEPIDRSRYRHAVILTRALAGCLNPEQPLLNPKQPANYVQCCEALSSLLRSPSRQTRHHHMHASPTSCKHQRKPRGAELYTQDNTRNSNIILSSVF